MSINGAQQPFEPSKSNQILIATSSFFLIAGIVSAIFGHSHMGDDGLWLDNPFYGGGVAVAVLSGCLLGYAFYKRQIEEDPKTKIDAWYEKLFTMIQGVYKTIKRLNSIEILTKIGISILLSGAFLAILAQIHLHYFGSGTLTDHFPLE